MTAILRTSACLHFNAKADEVDGSRSRHLSAKLGCYQAKPEQKEPPGCRLPPSAWIWPNMFFKFTL
jgi:hypothetical protein